MANTSSAKKAQRVAKRRRVFNARRKKVMKDVVKEVGKLIAAKKAADAAKVVPQLYQAIDKAAKNNTISKNTIFLALVRLSK